LIKYATIDELAIVNYGLDETKPIQTDDDTTAIEINNMSQPEKHPKKLDPALLTAVTYQRLGEDGGFSEHEAALLAAHLFVTSLNFNRSKHQQNNQRGPAAQKPKTKSHNQQSGVPVNTLPSMPHTVHTERHKQTYSDAGSTLILPDQKKDIISIPEVQSSSQPALASNLSKNLNQPPVSPTSQQDKSSESNSFSRTSSIPRDALNTSAPLITDFFKHSSPPTSPSNAKAAADLSATPEVAASANTTGALQEPSSIVPLPTTGSPTRLVAGGDSHR